MKYRCYGCMNEYQTDSWICPNCGYDQRTAPENALHMRPGSVLSNRYLIGKVLGFGGFGVTYLAWDHVLQQRVAIKEYLPSEFATRAAGKTEVTVFSANKAQQFADGMRKFVEEAKRLAKFQNEPGIVRIYDSFEANNTAYVIMEFLDGETLDDYLKRVGKVSVEQAIDMLLPVIKSLSVLHKGGVIYGAVSPYTIMVLHDGKAKLLESWNPACWDAPQAISPSVTVNHGYSAPEQYPGQGHTGSYTDIYAVGATVYRMTTGITPPDALKRSAQNNRKKGSILLRPSKFCTISKSQEKALLNAMGVTVEERTQSISEFLEQLQTKKLAKRAEEKKLSDYLAGPSWVKRVVLLGGAAVIAAFILLFSGTSNTVNNLITSFMLGEDETRVPSVINTPVSTAQEILIEHKLECLIGGRETSDEIPADMVLRQSVDAGEIVEINTEIELYISAPMAPTLEKGVMPNVTYYTEQEATEMLTELGVAEVEVEYEPSDTVAPGIVIDSNKQPGENLSQGDLITIVVSDGSKNESSPSFVEGNESQIKLDEADTPLSLNTTSLHMSVGEVANLSVTGNPPFSWVSSQPDVVKVEDGTVTALKTGNATITVSSGGKKASCDIIVSFFTQAEIDEDQWLFDDMISPEELTIGGTPFWEVTVQEVAQIFPCDDPDWFYLDDRTQYTQMINRFSAVSATQYIGQPGLSYIDLPASSLYAEVRGISFGDSSDIVLAKLGISASGKDYANDILHEQVLRIVNDNGSWVTPENVRGTMSNGSAIELIWPNFQSENELTAQFIFDDNFELTRANYWFVELGY